MTGTRVLTERFTRRDYVRLPEGFPAELIEGDLVREPAPTYGHQRLISRLQARLFAVAGTDRVLPAPTDVFVDEWSVLQPDIQVTPPGPPVHRRPEEEPIPVVVFEVLSPATARRDRQRKTAIYLRAGVREVWLVDPEAGAVEVHTAGGVERVTGNGRAASAALAGFTLAWSDVAD